MMSAQWCNAVSSFLPFWRNREKLVTTRMNPQNRP